MKRSKFFLNINKYINRFFPTKNKYIDNQKIMGGGFKNLHLSPCNRLPSLFRTRAKLGKFVSY